MIKQFTVEQMKGTFIFLNYYICMLFLYSNSTEGLLSQINDAVNALQDDSLIETFAFSSQSFLLVFQTPQQQKWLTTYGNVVTCMDAIYKTNRYAFPCFFLVIKTSIGVGRVVGTITARFETAQKESKF